MKYKYFALIMLVTALGFVVVYTPVSSQPDGAVSLAAAGNLTLSHNRISWTPEIAYQGATLTLSGANEFFLQADFAAGEPLVYTVEGNLADGGYIFEWRLQPAVDATLAAELATLDADSRQSRVAELQAAGLLPDPADTVQSGYITILDGAIVGGGSESEAVASDEGLVAPADQVISDDLIVQASGCFGFDCVNGESFGSDTIIIKENNLRIFFNDTSNSASFPANDWRLIGNDSTNGGGNYFAIEDATAGRRSFRLDAGAPANALRIDSAGDIGLGKSNPIVELHMADGDTPTIRLEQDGSSGFTAQTFDLAANEANFFIRDVTNGSTLPFKLKPGAPTSSIFIAADGDIGLGTESPAGPFHVRESGTDVFVVNSNGDVTISGILTEASDVNSKENFTAVDPQGILARIVNMPITMWNYINDENNTIHMGPMAQDFYAAFGLGADDKHIAPLDGNGVAFAGIQGLFELFQTHDAELEALQEENEELKARVEDLEAAVDALLKAQAAEGE